MTDPRMRDALLVELADSDPWTGDRDNDWCFFCLGGQEDYGPKPWSGHRPSCLWVRIQDALGRETSHLVDGVDE